MAELRYNPLLGDWIMIASHRQDRPQMPEGWCPFCPGSGKVPEHYTVLPYDNDFPALSQNPPSEDDVATDFYLTRPAYGKCEVILYSPEHTTTLAQLYPSHIRELIDLWVDRYKKMSEDTNIKYILIFENKGEPVGVTMPHPHGQIYGYSIIPQKIARELSLCKAHYEAKGSCLICDIEKEETSVEKRVIFENEDFTCILPFFTEYPYGVYIISKRHLPSIIALTAKEKDSLAMMLKNTAGMLDALFDYSFPYMMCLHQCPVNDIDTGMYYHFHIEFYPPMRSRDKQKFNASSETGAWAHCNPTAPEEKAQELRAAYEKFIRHEK